MNTPSTRIEKICTHCGDACPHPVTAGEFQFCCEGCRTVYQILTSNGMCTYYELNAHPGISPRVFFRNDKFAFLDLPEVARKLVHFSDGAQTHVTFYLPQIHCSSCLWLLEHLHTLHEGIFTSQVNFSAKEVTIVLNTQQITLRQTVELLARIGYEPHLSLQDISTEKVSHPDRRRWYKIGVAGFCFGNIMMLSFPAYFAGEAVLEPQLRSLFTVLIVCLSMPVILYAASEFFITAWKGLMQRHLNIDAPIALALLITFGRSLYELFTSSGSGYLDSLSGIVFFMLLGRWLQDKTYRTISFDRDYKSFFPIAVSVVRGETNVSLQVEDLRPGDRIRIHHGELIPVDGMLSKGHAMIDYSFVTGESLPVAVAKGELIYAGGKQTEGVIEILAVREVSQSYLTHLWNQSRRDKDQVTEYPLIDLVSRYFTYIVFGLASVAALYWLFQGEQHRMWNALTTILIVACPCALLLSSNFTLGNMLRLLSREQFYVRNAHVLETLSKADTLVFDKTGTLTQKNRIKVTYEGRPLDKNMKRYFASLLVHSGHPLSVAVFQYLNYTPTARAESFKVIPNGGIEGWIEDHHLKAGSPEFLGIPLANTKGSIVAISIDQEHLGTFQIHNAYRFGVFALFNNLRKSYKLALLSGDNDAEAVTLQQQMGPECELLFQQRPDEKMKYIRHLQETEHARVVMIGDGLNDAAALQESQTGIALCEDDNPFTPAADAILHASKISALDRILAYVRSGKKIILASFAVSVLYNLAGLTFAVQGTLSPVIAAILMPMSSITIVVFTFGLSSLLAKKYKIGTTAPAWNQNNMAMTKTTTPL